MNYNLNDLLKDKELTKSLTENPFSFTDKYGDFFAVNFQDESMRQNHITVFEVLYSLGGDELFEKLLANGSTCLTKDPNAAKVGVQAIADAEGWYLKTNASSLAAFSSILNGLAGLDDNDRFSFRTKDKSTTTHIASDYEYHYSTCQDYEPFFAEIVKREDGRYVVVNPDEGKIISFSIQTEQDTLEFDNFYEIGIFLIEEEIYDEETMENEIRPTSIAYKYQLEKDGKWGYFSKTLSQLTPPCFEDIIMIKNDSCKAICAWEKFGFNTMSDNFLYFTRNDIELWENVELDLASAYKVDSSFYPTYNAYIQRTFSLNDSFECVCYIPQDGLGEGFVFLSKERTQYLNNLAQSYINGHRVRSSYGILSAEGTEMKLPIHSDKIHATDCLKLFASDKPEHIVYKRLNSADNCYLVKRDGYTAIAKYVNQKNQFAASYSGELSFVELITPYAFTDVTAPTDGYAVVDRFGKKGLLNLSTKEYIIPCDYEYIKLITADTYRIKKADFCGMVRISDGQVKWTERLHREE